MGFRVSAEGFETPGKRQGRVGREGFVGSKGFKLVSMADASGDHSARDTAPPPPPPPQKKKKKRTTPRCDKVQSSDFAFAALRRDGSVVTWGDQAPSAKGSFRGLGSSGVYRV